MKRVEGVWKYSGVTEKKKYFGKKIEEKPDIVAN